MARGNHVFHSCEICKQTYIIAQKYARHLKGDIGSTGNYFSMCTKASINSLVKYYDIKMEVRMQWFNYDADSCEINQSVY